MITKKNGTPDLRYRANKKFATREYLFWRTYGCLIIAALLGALSAVVLVKTLYDMKPKPVPVINEIKVKEVEAYKTPCDYDPITYIRCRGEQLNMPNEDIMKMIRIARAESGFNQYAKNPNSTAKGIYQFIDSTWRSNCLKDGNVYNFVDNINCAWKVYQTQGDRPWMASYNVWSK